MSKENLMSIQTLVKKCSPAFVAMGLWIVSSAIAVAQEITEYDPQYTNYYGTLDTSEASFYKYKVPANTFGILTLKNSGGSSDFDIAVYEYIDEGYQLIGTGENSDTQTELVIAPPSTGERYIYIKVFNYGSATSEYKLYADYVSPMNKFLLSGAKTLISCGLEQEDVSDRNAGRMLTGIFSLLEGNGLTGVATDLVLDEIAAEMREQFGYGCLGDFAVDWTISIVSGFYKNYP